MTDSAFFLSDCHFGLNPSHAVPNRETLFCRFLESLHGRATHLFILGDLFEFWMEYEYFIPKNHFAVNAALYSLSRSGVEIHYIAGNHDFNLGLFFNKHLGIQTHTQPFQISIQGIRLLLLHGDGMARSDTYYRMLRKLLHHPVANRLFKLVHPDWGMKLANFTGRLSRHRQPCIHFDEYHDAVKRYFQKGAEAVIYGHTHRAYLKKRAGGVEINTGDWISGLNCAILEESVFSLQRFHPKRLELV
jgi:UDP-2,3-diacylglucosamine hydrolase